MIHRIIRQSRSESALQESASIDTDTYGIVVNKATDKPTGTPGRYELFYASGRYEIFNLRDINMKYFVLVMSKSVLATTEIAGSLAYLRYSFPVYSSEFMIELYCKENT